MANHDKNTLLLEAVFDQIAVDADRFTAFLAILWKDVPLRHLVESMETMWGRPQGQHHPRVSPTSPESTPLRGQLQDRQSQFYQREAAQQELPSQLHKLQAMRLRQEFRDMQEQLQGQLQRLQAQLTAKDELLTTTQGEARQSQLDRKEAMTTNELMVQLRKLQVTEVEDTGKELGRGAYGVVKELRVKGHRCAGKQLHETLFFESSGKEHESVTALFAQECLRHSKLHHPNIVQLIGIYFSQESRAPTLIMELMPLSLTMALKQHPSMPSHVKNGILLDVAYGLHFLHGQTPPIIHRDLTANNILLSENMRAKIADLGQATVVKTGPMTKTPGHPAYMPPESFTDDPKYDTMLDMFSFGALIIHTFIHDWPTPKGLFRYDPAHPHLAIPLTEIEHRAHHLKRMGEGHPLKGMTIRCLQNNPAFRPTAAVVIRELEGIVRNGPPPANIFELQPENTFLRDNLQAKDVEIAIHRKQIREKGVTTKTTEVNALLHSKDASVVSSHSFPARMATRVTFNVKNRNVLVMGITRAGISTVCNHIIGEECFHVDHRALFCSDTTGASHVQRLIRGPDNTMYNVKVVDTVGFLNPCVSSKDVLWDTKKCLQCHLPEGVSLVLFVRHPYSLNLEEHRTIIELIRKNFRSISQMSALVLSQCEDRNDKGREVLVRTFTNEPSFASFMRKGVYLVGFPHPSTIEDEIWPFYEKAIADDAKKLRSLLFRSTDMHSTFLRSF